MLFAQNESFPVLFPVAVPVIHALLEANTIIIIIGLVTAIWGTGTLAVWAGPPSPDKYRSAMKKKKIKRFFIIPLSKWDCQMFMNSETLKLHTAHPASWKAFA